jgi:hypothetical protein
MPDTLLQLMRFIAEDYLPEITAHVACANSWLDENPDVGSGTASNNKSMAKGLGFAPFTWRGAEIQTVVIPYRFYLLQRLLDVVGQADDADRATIDELFDQTDLGGLLTLQPKRRMERRDNQEVWGKLT